MKKYFVLLTSHIFGNVSLTYHFINHQYNREKLIKFNIQTSLKVEISDSEINDIKKDMSEQTCLKLIAENFRTQQLAEIKERQQTVYKLEATTETIKEIEKLNILYKILQSKLTIKSDKTLGDTKFYSCFFGRNSNFRTIKKKYKKY